MTVAGTRSDEPRPDGATRASLRGIFDPEELRRRNLNAVVIDVLYLTTTAFFSTLLVRGFWPAVIAGIPLATMLYFAWESTEAFFVGQLVVVVLTVAATHFGVVPL